MHKQPSHASTPVKPQWPKVIDSSHVEEPVGTFQEYW